MIFIGFYILFIMVNKKTKALKSQSKDFVQELESYLNLGEFPFDYERQLFYGTDGFLGKILKKIPSQI